MPNHTARRILIVEDEFLLAMDLEYLLAGMGHTVVGLATRVPTAVELALRADIDFAILDLNLAGIQTFPVADILRQRGIPFIFATGYGSAGLVDGYRDEPTLQKPYQPEELQRLIAEAAWIRA
ncbi:response regulator [Mesorhizobium sp. PAMC28654]|uniref:response regulator n=1 Tax=Mesorhizobium sp. PAMC28654 TaxID=2880934 RepID=UPI001D0A2907|nr:response regulator [Mesorhizobium sp. PAMC28654]UDL89336.1 response regulator [Mesorhizobium sp. PAMC28654]